MVKKKKKIEVVFIDLMAAYYTVNHNLLISKIKVLTKDDVLDRSTNCLLRNRRFCLELEEREVGGEYRKTVYYNEIY